MPYLQYQRIAQNDFTLTVAPFEIVHASASVSSRHHDPRYPSFCNSTVGGEIAAWIHRERIRKNNTRLFYMALTVLKCLLQVHWVSEADHLMTLRIVGYVSLRRGLRGRAQPSGLARPGSLTQPLG